MEYYGNNDWRDYLALKHHGIVGMKWGKRNGPPYPLGYGDHSSAEKKANPKGRLDNYEPAGRIKKKKVTKSNSSSQTVSKAQAFVGGAAGGAISEAADLAKRAKRDGVSMNEAAIRKLQEKVDNGTASSYEKWMLKRQRQTQEKKAQKEAEKYTLENLKDSDVRRLNELDQKIAVLSGHYWLSDKEQKSLREMSDEYDKILDPYRRDFQEKFPNDIIENHIPQKYHEEFANKYSGIQKDRDKLDMSIRKLSGTIPSPAKEKKLSRRQQRQKDKDDYEMAIRNDNGDIDYKKFLDNSNFEFIMLDRETEQRIKDSIDRLNEEHWRDGTNEKYRKMKADRRGIKRVTQGERNQIKDEVIEQVKSKAKSQAGAEYFKADENKINSYVDELNKSLKSTAKARSAAAARTKYQTISNPNSKTGTSDFKVSNRDLDAKAEAAMKDWGKKYLTAAVYAEANGYKLEFDKKKNKHYLVKA